MGRTHQDLSTCEVWKRYCQWSFCNELKHELNQIVDADGRHHFIDRILLRNAAKSQLVCYSEILLELCSFLVKFYKNLQFPKFHSWLTDNFEEKSPVFTLNHPPPLWYSYSRLAWLYIHNRSFTGNLDGDDASHKPRGSCCGGRALMFWKFTIIYTIVNFTLLHKTFYYMKSICRRGFYSSVKSFCYHSKMSIFVLLIL